MLYNLLKANKAVGNKQHKQTHRKKTYMPEEQKATAPIGTTDLKVSRNGIDMSLANFKIVRGKNEGTVYPAPVVTTENLDEVINWYGRTDLVNLFQSTLKRTAQLIYRDALDETTGELNTDLFLQEFQELTSKGLSKAQLQEQLDEATETFSNEVMKFNEADTSDVSVVNDFKAKMNEIKQRINGLKAQIEAKARKPRDEAEPAASIPA